MKLTEIPIFRMYHLKIDAVQREKFLEAGVHNFLTSYQNEPGTLAMYATHLDLAGTDNYVFEIYQNEAHYRMHADSPQFQAYGQVAQKIVVQKDLQELQPNFLNIDNESVYYLATLDSDQKDWLGLELLTKNQPSLLDAELINVAKVKAVQWLKVDTMINRSFKL